MRSSKAALDMLVRSAADELGGFGIRINSIRPGVVESEATAMMFEHMPHIIDDYKKNMPLGRVGEPGRGRRRSCMVSRIRKLVGNWSKYCG